MEAGLYSISPKNIRWFAKTTPNSLHSIASSESKTRCGRMHHLPTRFWLRPSPWLIRSWKRICAVHDGWTERWRSSDCGRGHFLDAGGLDIRKGFFADRVVGGGERDKAVSTDGSVYLTSPHRGTCAAVFG